MRPARFLGLAALGAALVDAPARADEPPVSPTKQAASLSALPATTYDATGASLPTAPARIAATERVAGLWVTKAHATGPAVATSSPSKITRKKKGRKAKPVPAPTAPGRATATIVTTGPITASMSPVSSGFTLMVGVADGTPIPSETCLRTLVPPARRRLDPPRWSDAVAPGYLLDDEAGPPIHLDNGLVQADRTAGPVRLLRAERLVTPAGGSASLEIVEAWIDTRTQGAREVRRATIPLATMLRAAGNVAVYAFRQEQEVSLVVRTPRAVENPDASGDLVWRSDEDSGSTLCGHALIRLGARAIGDAETTFVLGEVELPVLPATDGSPETKEIRAFRIALSDAWLGSAAEPIVSASFGWFGKPRPAPGQP